MKISINVMDEKSILINSIEKIHTTKMGVERIKKNLKIDSNDVVKFCVEKIIDKNCNVIRNGKNYYATFKNMIFTINSYSFTIITAHLKK